MVAILTRIETSYYCGIRVMVRIMVLNATFNSIWIILWRSVLLMEETNRSTSMKTTVLPQVT